MELKDFVSSTIEQISRGILEASERLGDTNAIVSPLDYRINSQDSQALGRTKNPGIPDQVDGGTRIVQRVDFDIAVTVDDSESTSAGAKISVLSIGLGAGAESSSKTGTSSRIKFTVPVVLPGAET